MTLMHIVDCIRANAPKISSEQLAGALHAPEPSATHTQCFSNAQLKAQQDSGSALSGWMFNYREVVALPGPGYVIAVNHAVWLAPDKRLVDVTPFHPDPKHHPTVVNGSAVLFLPDLNAGPLVSGQAGLALPSWFFSLTSDKNMEAHVAKLTADELDGWEKRVAGNNAFKVSPRAAALLQSRRK